MKEIIDQRKLTKIITPELIKVSRVIFKSSRNVKGNKK